MNPPHMLTHVIIYLSKRTSQQAIYSSLLLFKKAVQEQDRAAPFACQRCDGEQSLSEPSGLCWAFKDNGVHGGSVVLSLVSVRSLLLAMLFPTFLSCSHAFALQLLPQTLVCPSTLHYTHCGELIADL